MYIYINEAFHTIWQKNIRIGDACLLPLFMPLTLPQSLPSDLYSTHTHKKNSVFKRIYMYIRFEKFLLFLIKYKFIFLEI